MPQRYEDEKAPLLASNSIAIEKTSASPYRKSGIVGRMRKQVLDSVKHEEKRLRADVQMERMSIVTLAQVAALR
jgi:hypothetical protein